MCGFCSPDFTGSIPGSVLSPSSVCLSHFNKISPLGVAAVSSFHPSLNSQVTRGYETAPFTKTRALRIRIPQQMLWCAVTQCSWPLLVWRRMLPAATKVPSFSWEPEPWAKRTEPQSTAYHTLRASYQGSPKPVCSIFWKPVRRGALVHLI